LSSTPLDTIDMNDNLSAAGGRQSWKHDEAARKYDRQIALEKIETKVKKGSDGKLPPPAAAVDPNSVQARTEAIIKREELHGKRELVAPTMGLGNKGRSAGFYCDVCDLTFKDSNSYLDHLNSAGHHRKAGTTGKVEYASLEQVQARLAWLKQRKIEMEKNKGEELDLSKRIANRRKMEEEEQQRRRDKKKAKRLLRKQQQLGASDVEMNESS
jgi:U4/U6.U5 tri-snRNP component SNU23